MMKLSDDLKKWRADRPDEWTMDRFIEKAKALENTWISVEDQLPEKDLRTLVYAPELDETMKIRIIDSQFLKICSDVTHWMPLPSAPDTGEEG